MSCSVIRNNPKGKPEMRTVITLEIAACILFVIHYLIPQPNGAGDLAAILAGAAVVWYVLAAVDYDR